MTDVKTIMTVSGLLEAIDDFIRCNRHAGQTELRWLAARLESDVLPIARQVRSGSLDDEHRRSITDFRCDEIAELQRERQQEIDELDRERAKLRATP